MLLKALKNIFLALLAFALSLFVGNPLYTRWGRKRKVKQQNVEVIIVGAGISGLEIAKRLLDIGLVRFTILEQGSEIGGTWYWNQVNTKCTFRIEIHITIFSVSRGQM